MRHYTGKCCIAFANQTPRSRNSLNNPSNVCICLIMWRTCIGDYNPKSQWRDIFRPRINMFRWNAECLLWMSKTCCPNPCPGGTFLKSSQPSAAYMRQWIGSALIQIMACRLLGAKPLAKPTLGNCQLALGTKFRWNFNQNTKLFIHENASENIACENDSHFVQGRWVNSYMHILDYLNHICSRGNIWNAGPLNRVVSLC